MRFAFCANSCKPHNRAVFRKLPKVAECVELVSIPVRVTISTAHIWLYKADCGLFFLSERESSEQRSRRIVPLP